MRERERERKLERVKAQVHVHLSHDTKCWPGTQLAHHHLLLSHTKIPKPQKNKPKNNATSI